MPVSKCGRPGGHGRQTERGAVVTYLGLCRHVCRTVVIGVLRTPNDYVPVQHGRPIGFGVHRAIDFGIGGLFTGCTVVGFHGNAERGPELLVLIALVKAPRESAKPS